MSDFKLFKIKPDRRGQGTALSVTPRALKNLAAAGVDRVEMLAARHDHPGRPDNKWTGYLVWPKFGFDGRLFEQHFDGFPDEIVHHFSGAKTLQELYNERGGREAWEAFGTNIRLSFDLQPQSANWAYLTDYLAKKGIDLDAI